MTKDGRSLLVAGPVSNHTICMAAVNGRTCSMQLTLDAKWLTSQYSSVDITTGCAANMIAVNDGEVYVSGLTGSDCSPSAVICTITSPQWQCDKSEYLTRCNGEWPNYY